MTFTHLLNESMHHVYHPVAEAIITVR